MGFIDTLIEGLEEGFDKAFEKHETTQGAARVLLKAEEQEGWISSDEMSFLKLTMREPTIPTMANTI